MVFVLACGQFCSRLQRFGRFFHPGRAAKSMERDVIGDWYRYP